MGASILPVTFHNGQIYFLFGKERNIDENPGWSDFGGGTEKGETFRQTAIREGCEELTGFLGSSADIQRMLNKFGTFNIDYNTEGYSTYRCHIFPIIYDDKLPFYYNNNQQFLQHRLDKKIIKNSKIFEKTEIKWFSFDDIKKHNNEFRSFYKNIANLILKNKTKIENFIKSKLTAKTTAKTMTKMSRKKTLKRKNKTLRKK